MIEALQDVFRKMLIFGHEHCVSEFDIILTIDDTMKHTNLPARMTRALEILDVEVKTSSEVAVMPTPTTKITFRLRECGMHRTKRWEKTCPGRSARSRMLVKRWLKPGMSAHLYAERSSGVAERILKCFERSSEFPERSVVFLIVTIGK